MVRIKIDFFVSDTISAFRSIQRYFRLIESQIEKVKKKEWEKLKSLPVPTDEEEYQAEYLLNIDAHKHEYGKVLPRLVSYSFVTILYTELEFRINEICRELRKREEVPVKLSDFRGDLIERFAKFLKVANKPQLTSDERTEIQDFMIVRNCIVHNNGFLENFGKSRKLKSIAKSKSHIEIVGKSMSERINFTNRFCYSRIEFFIPMFRRLFDVLGFGPEYPTISDEK